MISFTLYVAPVAWERVKRSGEGFSYVPPKTRAYKQTVAFLARHYRPHQLLDGPLILTARFYVSKPARPKYSEPATRPDLDNYMKALKDALTGVIWTDDARICRYGSGSGKYFVSNMESRPRIEVLVEPISKI